MEKRPLTWKEARTLFRDVLQSYLNETAPRRSAPADWDSNKKIWFLSRWIQRFDFDVIVALSLSVALLVFVSLSLISKENSQDILSKISSTLQPQASVEIYWAEVAAAAMLVLASLMGLWVVRRRRFLFWNDIENAKRREIRRYLRTSGDITDDPPAALKHLTSLNGVYPVYRMHGDKAGWAKVPSLLLVPGDWIALQIGDIVPADVYLRKGSKTTLVRAGTRLSVSTFDKQDETNLPPGKTVSLSTEDLLTLCNKIQIFAVMSTPLESFLRRPPVVPQSSRMNRRIHDVRLSLLILAMVIFALTLVIASSRRKAADGDMTLVVSNAFLAALGVLPIVGPGFLFFLEILGTARVLTTVHPYASQSVASDSNRSESSRYLWFRYVLATGLSRVMSRNPLFRCLVPSCFVRIPPASLNLLEKLGEATAFTLIDDELVCEPQSIPQQLLIPSGNGLKLLDLFPTHGDDRDEHSDHSESILSEEGKRQRGKLFDSDSDTEDGTGTHFFHSTLRRRARRRFRRPQKGRHDDDETQSCDLTCSRIEVQFEEPNWWQYLPSLKSIGLACLLQNRVNSVSHNEATGDEKSVDAHQQDHRAAAEQALVKLICTERNCKQLRALADCVGLSTEENPIGEHGDISPFHEKLRLHVLTRRLFYRRLTLDVHERSSEQSRWWGKIRPDSTSVIVEDSRTKANQLLTVGDPSVVISFCDEAWQGENATILPLAAIDRQTVLETTRNWKLADLDVSAFSYTPVPCPLEKLLTDRVNSQVYLLDNSESTVSKDKKEKGAVADEWAFVKSQVFLGVLGSSVMPRREIQKLLDVLNEAGVRFVYFSPRNMRRQKELATQIGIDVAWNCAISLRALEKGEAEDPHRMVSTYADWDVNAKLPHGIDDVKKHLEQVDNVPLLVSLFTDATKPTTREMVEIFQKYNDTVISVGLSHLTRNAGIFAASNVAIGIDILGDAVNDTEENSTLPLEFEFISAISSFSCAFRLRGASSVAQMSSLIEKSRIALEAATAGTVFLMTSCLSFSLFVLFSVCTPSSSEPFVPILGSAILLLIVLPCLGLSIAMGKGDRRIMARVPVKNDETIAFAPKERSIFYAMAALKALLPAVLPWILHMIAFGEFMIYLEPEQLALECPEASSWVDVVRCSGIRNTNGPAWRSAGSLAFSEFTLCTLIASAGFVHRFLSIRESRPWDQSMAWLITMLGSTVAVITVFLSTTDPDAFWRLPWYSFVVIVLSPLLCLFVVELCKRTEAKHEDRSEKLRRLQFETRLGAWSPR